MDVTILIATHGDDLWRARGDSCYQDHDARFEKPIVWHHEPDGTIAETRNRCVDIADEHGVGRGWLCFVDADDFLETGYFDAMESANELMMELLTPAIRYGAAADPMIFNDRNMLTMNPCPIGTLIHRDVFDAVGRFWEERAWEDWSLFRRAWLHGCEIVFVEGAVYRANSLSNGRNSKVRDPQKLRDDIIDSHQRWKRNRDN